MRLLLISITLATLIGCSSIRLPLVHTTYDVLDSGQTLAGYQRVFFGNGSDSAGNNTRRGEPLDRDEKHLSGIIQIPLEKDGSGFYVDGIVNGTLKVKFYLDTETSSATLSHQSYKKLITRGGVTEAQLFSRLESSSTTATGELIETIEFLLASLDVGPIHTEMVRTSVVKGEGSSDTLGLAFLDGLGEFTIDVENSILVVHPSDVYRPVPRLSYFASSDQQWMQAMQHWDIAAESEAVKIAEKLKSDVTPLHLVAEDSEGSDNPFINAYTKFLAQHLLSNGKSLITDPRLAEINDAPELRSDVVVTRHNATEEEAMITTTIHHAGQMIFSSSTVYYLNPPDAKNYEAKKKAQKKNLAVVGS